MINTRRILAACGLGVCLLTAAAVEPPGPSSRKTPFVISEIMYNPATITVVTNGATNNLSTEFLEIYNSNPFYEDLSGFRLTGDIDFTFPKGSGIAGLNSLVLAKNTNEFQAFYHLTNLTILGYSNSLGRSGTIRLRNNSGGIVLEISYDHKNPWPVGADGTGHSLVLARPSLGENDPAAWSISDQVGGSPGVSETFTNDPLRDVVINEFLAHTDPPLVDTVELYNHSNQPRDVSGCGLADDATTNKFLIPPGTIIPPRGFVAFDQNQTGIALSSGGETIYFWNTNRTRLLDVVQFGAQENGVSMGRVPDGSAEFYRLKTRTLGTNNSDLLVSSVVLNELMYDPVSGDSNDEYVELHNRTNVAVNVGGWRLEGGVSFTIPSNTVIAPNSFLVIAENLTNLLAKYPQLNAANTLGNYSGSLKNSGERVALSLPDTTDGTNTIHIVVDEVAYRSGGQWPGWAHGGGSSLERRDAHANPRLAANWADSDESAKAPWTTIDFTGVMDNGSGSANALEGGLQGEGECLLDDVAVIYNGNNLVVNSNFVAGLGNWIVRGSHIRSSLDAANGFGGGQCLRLRASSRADFGPNRFYVPLSSAPPNGATVTIRAKVRWLCGWPEILLRLHGNYLEAPTRLNLPANLGTPGLVNSRVTTNAAPAIYEVAHSPVLPADGQPVVVTAQVHDPDGVATLQLKYRADSDTTYTSVNMADGGSGGDAIAGDGIFSASIPGQPADTLVAFVVSASDGFASSVFPTNTPANSALPRECLVRFGDPIRASSFGTYRQWFTAAAINAWTNSPILGNEPIEGTFVYGDFRAIYNFNSHYAGSPSHQNWTSPLNDCHYSIEMPRDDLMLGTDNFNKLHGPGNNPFQDASLQREQTGIWIARQLGLPWTNRRFVNMYVNGSLRKTNSLMEDVQVPGGDFLAEYFPDDADGDLHKINGWWEMNDAASGAMPGTSRASWATLGQFYSPAGSGSYKPARYRWSWQPRGFSSTGNDFTNFFRLLDAVNTPAGDALTANLEAEADMESWMRTWAIRKSMGDWDFYGGSGNGQNGYLYRPGGDGWKLFIWDINILIGNNDSLAPGTALFPTANYSWQDGALLTKLYNHPPFRRMYLRALKEIGSGPLQAANVNAVLDAKYNAFTADGLTVFPPDTSFSYTDIRSKDGGTNVPFSGSMKFWLADAGMKILARVAQEDASSFSVNGSASFSTNNNLITLSGNAPVEIKTITVNGNAYPVAWLTNAAWTMSVPLAAGTNTLVFQAWDVSGNLLTNFSQTITVNFTGTPAPPEGSVVFNEILHHPTLPGAEFVELFNRATNAFDLSGWRVNGLSYTFPPGALIAPQSFLVLAKDWDAYANTFGVTNPPFDFFGGTLDPDGETLTLFRPGVLPGEEIVVDRVRYESVAPWPTATNGTSLQLVDSAQDNSRVANWSVIVTNTITVPSAPQWVRGSATGIPRATATSRPLYIYLESAGDIYLDDVSVVAGSVAEAGANILTNGGFETSLSPWTIGSIGNNSASAISTAFKHSGSSSLHLIASAAGSSQTSSIWQDFSSSLTVGATCTLSFWFLQSTNGGPLTVRFSNNGIAITTNPAPTSVFLSLAKATPGATNSAAATLPPFPPIWLNELQAANLTGPLDNFSERDPWTEIFNAGTNAFSLAGFYLTDTYTNLTKWAFPTNATLSATNFLLVWCDAQTNQSALNIPHAPFRLTNSTGQLALTRITNGAPQIVDYLNYTNLPANWSYGDFPNGQPFFRQTMFVPTPAASNTNASPPLTVFINEWLADNANTLADPADSQFEDWLEIYNPGTNTVNLGGYFLTDNLTNKFQFLIPTNGQYTIPPHGYLLVWADNESNQNATNRADLHASFALSKSGEALGIFAADGTAIDAITFGAQTTDVSQGRFPDGAAGIFSMTTRTPHTNNLIPNSAPLLAAISDQFTYEHQTVTFTATATDAESSVQTLTFSLTNSPAAASIGAVSGAFSWTIANVAVPSTNSVTVRVTDNGIPPLSDAKTFKVIVPSLPQLAATLSGNQIQLAWPAAQSGWRLEAQTNSSAGGLGTNWTTVANSNFTNQMFIPVDAVNSSVFFRLVYP